MFLMRFTERAYYNYTEAAVRNSPGGTHWVTISNSHFDPEVDNLFEPGASRRAGILLEPEPPTRTVG